MLLQGKPPAQSLKAMTPCTIDLNHTVLFLNICMKTWTWKFLEQGFYQRGFCVFHCFIFAQRPVVPLTKLCWIYYNTYTINQWRHTQWFLTLVGMQLQHCRAKKINALSPYEWLFFILHHDVPSLFKQLMVVPDTINIFRGHTVFVIVFGKIIQQEI